MLDKLLRGPIQHNYTTPSQKLSHGEIKTATLVRFAKGQTDRSKHWVKSETAVTISMG